MASAKLCDRCKRFYIEKAKKFKTHSGILSYVDLSTAKGYTIEKFDLCDDCAEDLWNWLNDPNFQIVDTAANKENKEEE